VYGVVADEAKRGDPGLNHIGANDLDWDGRALWVADVLGPTRIEETTGGQRWDRYRWSVSGHSYQAIASCGGSVWAGSEDDGLAVRGVAIGSRNGRSDWNHVNVLDGLPEDWIMAIGCAGKNSAWIGTYRSGVGRVDSLGWHPIVGLEGAWVQALATSGDTLWVGTADGLYTVDGGTSRLVSEENVWSILVDGDQIVLGTETGVVVLGTR
jgi:ligand-binding sensor domain-containing protein